MLCFLSLADHKTKASPTEQEKEHHQPLHLITPITNKVSYPTSSPTQSPTIRGLDSTLNCRSLRYTDVLLPLYHSFGTNKSTPPKFFLLRLSFTLKISWRLTVESVQRASLAGGSFLAPGLLGWVSEIPTGLEVSWTLSVGTFAWRFGVLLTLRCALSSRPVIALMCGLERRALRKNKKSITRAPESSPSDSFFHYSSILITPLFLQLSPLPLLLPPFTIYY